jgi:plastocyanin
MKLDLAKLPVAEAVVGFLVLMIIVSFVGAFSATSGSEGAAVSASPTSGSSSPGPSGSPGGPTSVVMHDNRFDPNDITVPAGTTVTVQIRNDGKTPHNLHVAGQGGDYTEDFCTGTGDPCSDPNTVRAGQTATLTYQAPSSAGEINFRCDFHPQEMTGKIKVQ